MSNARLLAAMAVSAGAPRMLLSVAALLLGMPQAMARDLHARLPADTIAFLEMNPGLLPREAAAGKPGFIDATVDSARAAGLLPREAAAVVDGIALGSVAGRRRSCLALLDADPAVDAKTQDLVINSVQVAWLVDTGGRPREMIDLLTAFLRHFAARDTAQQVQRTAPDSKLPYVEFRDATWPEWLTLAWAQDGDTFIVTLGRGAMEHCLAGRAAGPAPWDAALKLSDVQAEALGVGGAPAARLYVATRVVRERFPDVMQKTVLARTVAALDARENDAAILTSRVSGRVLSIDLAAQTGDKLTSTAWTLPNAAQSPVARVVPGEARTYAVLRVDWSVAFDRISSILGVLLDEPGKSTTPEVIRTFARTAGVNLQRDLLENLSPYVVLHDHPPHPLSTPGMISAIAGCKPGAEKTAQESMEKLLDVAAGAADRKAHAGDPSRPKHAELQHLLIRRQPDGIRHVHYGVLGPAWAWRGGVLFYSWSPAALRSILPSDATPHAKAFRETR